MEEASNTSHWLHRYGNKEYYAWRTLPKHHPNDHQPQAHGTARHVPAKRTTYHRPLGLVESAFDSDGRFFEGRADMNIQLDLECRSTLNDEDFREKILFAWAALRCRHLLIQARAVAEGSLAGEGERSHGADVDSAGKELHFAVSAPSTINQAVEDAGEHLVFLSDHFAHVDARDFYLHAQNTARVIDPSRALARLFVLPPQALPNGNLDLKLLMVCSHQVCDGLAMSIWLRSLIHLLNLPLLALRAELARSLDPAGILSRLPQAQEALYPPIAGSPARQRWFWLLTRILRHVRKPLPAAFPNPLRRTHPRQSSVPLSPIYAPILDYSRPAQLNAFPCSAKTSPRATQRLHALCREAGTSIGAGCFALAALIQMEFHERLHPNIPLDQRKPFITGFPLNPRAFFNHHVDPDSLMLGFSDGILLPFLPSYLSVEGKLKLLARRAHRQLATFQKRAGTLRDTAGLEYMSSRGAGRLLPVHYIASIERWQAKFPPPSSPSSTSPEEAQARPLNPQAAYPQRPNTTTQTCGVSSVGSKVSVLRWGMVPLNNDDSKDFVADFRSSHASVRPRDDEFLVGVGGDDESTIGINASVDANAIDAVLAGEFCRRLENILEPKEGMEIEGKGEGRGRSRL